MDRLEQAEGKAINLARRRGCGFYSTVNNKLQINATKPDSKNIETPIYRKCTRTLKKSNQ